MKSDGVLVHTLSKALEWMSNVSCITYSPHPHHLPVEVKEMKGLVPRSHMTMPGCEYTASDHPFRQLIAAICMSQFTGVRELRAEPIDKDVANHGTEFALGIFDLDDNEMAAARFVFQSLEKLVLNMSLKVSDEHTFGEVTDKFATLLRDTANLQHLHLHPTHWKPGVGAQPLFARLGLQTTWPKLQTLSLKGILADEKELSGIIKRHKQTLTNVRLSNCSLLEGVWADVVDEVVYGSKMYQFVLDCGNERGSPYIDYASLNTWERDSWKYEGHLEVAKDGERSFVGAKVFLNGGSLLTNSGRDKPFKEISI